MDFIHVLEYLWKAAWCFYDKGDSAVENGSPKGPSRYFTVKVIKWQRAYASVPRNKISPSGRMSISVPAIY
jgi:hypothetical protein